MELTILGDEKGLSSTKFCFFLPLNLDLLNVEFIPNIFIFWWWPVSELVGTLKKKIKKNIYFKASKINSSNATKR